MNESLLSRRELCLGCAAFGWSLTGWGAVIAAQRSSSAADPPLADPPLAAAAGAGRERAARTVRFLNGATVPALGQGTWHLGQGRHPEAVEADALRTGIALGMTLIDTSGNYGNGRSEEFVGRVIHGERDRIFLVTKVEADEVSGDGIPRACDASLARLGTGYIDLYLLHAPVPSRELSGVVARFEQLRAAGKIRAWGVSNFDLDLMQKLFQVPDGRRCATNQVPYSLHYRRIERDLLPWCREQGMPVMAYSPLGGDRHLVVGDRALQQIAAKHRCSAAAVALAWVIRGGNVIAIPESGSPQHTRENAEAFSVTLTPQDLMALNAAYPGPSGAAWR